MLQISAFILGLFIYKTTEFSGKNSVFIYTVYLLIHVDAKQEEHAASLQMAPDNRETIKQAQVDIDDNTVKPRATEEKRMSKNTMTTELSSSEQHHPCLPKELTKHSAKWRDIGSYLGSLPSELDVIQASPLLLSNAPNSWLSTMLACRVAAVGSRRQWREYQHCYYGWLKK